MRLRQRRWMIAAPGVVLAVGLLSALGPPSQAAPAAARWGAALDCGSVTHSYSDAQL